MFSNKYIDILINNVGIIGKNIPTHEITLQEWENVINVNMKGVFLCTKYGVPLMLKKKKGSIVNLSSIYGIVAAGTFPAYHASKGAVRLMTKNDALTYAPYGIRVNSVHPGYIWTSMSENYLKSTSDNLDNAKKEIIDQNPLGCIGETIDVAYGILYLASDEAKFITGTELVIDGGYTTK
jgi:NAD(P)-dependent dehydrogenase (short-subunit alcohol dehydrogenase family)